MSIVYEIDLFLNIKEKINQKKYELYFTKKKNEFEKRKQFILTELKIKKNILTKNDFLWRRESILSKLLNKVNKDLLDLNSEINKLTESNFLMIYKNIITIIKKKTDISQKNKTKYIFENLFEKCLIQIIFNSLYICFLNKLLQDNELNNDLQDYLKIIIKNIKQIILHTKKLEDYDFPKHKFSDLIKNNISSNKNYIYLGNLISLLFLYDIINLKNFNIFLTKFIDTINNYIENENINNNVMERFINILIGLIEFGFSKTILNIDNDSKINLKIQIERLINTKKISMRIKFNLQNMYEDLTSGTKKIKKYVF